MQRTKPRPPIATISILLFCIVFFAFVSSRTLFALSRFVGVVGFIPETITMPSQWYRILTATIVHENALFLAISVLFLAFLGGPFEKRQGTLRYLSVFFGAVIVSYVLLGVLTWGQGMPSTGAFAGVGGIVGAWAAEACGRKRVSYHKSVVVRDFEELPIFLVVALWFFALYISALLFAADMLLLFLPALAGTLAGAVIHLALSGGRGKLIV